MVAGLGLSVRPSELNFKKMEARSKHYFERMGLFELLGLDSEMHIKTHESSGRFIPIQKIEDNPQLDRFITEMIPLLHKKPEEVESIKYVISELVRNVFEHAKSPVGAIVCAQYYKDSNIIRIGVVDRGIGIKESLTRCYHPEDDLSSIRLALEPGITGTTRKIGGTGENAGAGLFFIKSIAKVNRDFFMMYSGNGLYKLLKTPLHKEIRLPSDPFKDNHSKGNNLPHWQGTAVGIDISLGSHEKFNSLLDLIRTVYRKGRKERTQQKYKGAKFI
ncbi:MAG: sensor histidine kinase [Candidatus Aenigmarchaeota archaeon]|nr:sensor histidine kinase [Candidatus Aenigmarchaeota archaeon]